MDSTQKTKVTIEYEKCRHDSVTVYRERRPPRIKRRSEQARVTEILGGSGITNANASIWISYSQGRCFCRSNTGAKVGALRVETVQTHSCDGEWKARQQRARRIKQSAAENTFLMPRVVWSIVRRFSFPLKSRAPQRISGIERRGSYTRARLLIKTEKNRKIKLTPTHVRLINICAKLEPAVNFLWKKRPNNGGSTAWEKTAGDENSCCSILTIKWIRLFCNEPCTSSEVCAIFIHIRDTKIFLSIYIYFFFKLIENMFYVE